MADGINLTRDNELSAKEAATLDSVLGKHHHQLDTTGDAVTNTKPLYDTGSGGVSKAKDLRAKVGLDPNQSYGEYIKKGGLVPQGYELASKMLVKTEERQGLYDQHQNGALSYEDFLYQAYGKDLAKAKGDDFSSISYWFNRRQNGFYDDPMDNPQYVRSLLSSAEEAFKADELMEDMHLPNKVNEIISGEEMSAETFAELYSDQYTELAQELGGWQAVVDKYTSGMLTINPFIDSNGDGKISDGDYYFHDDGRAYVIGHDVDVRYDASGNPIAAKVNYSNIPKQLFSGVAKGVLGIFEGIGQVGALVFDGLAEIFTGGEYENLKASKDYLEWSEGWKNKTKFFNDGYYTSEEGWDDSYEAGLQIANGIGTIGGYILTTVATAGLASAATGAAATMSGTKALLDTTGKVGLKVGMQGVKAAGKSTTKYLATRSVAGAAKFVSGLTGFSNGVVGTGAKAAGPAIEAVAKDSLHAMSKRTLKGGVKKLTSTALGRSAASAAILTTRDFAENLAYSQSVNETLDEDQRRSNAQIFGDAATVALVNFGVSTALRATWDDVGITGRLQKVYEKFPNATIPSSFVEQNVMKKFFYGSGNMATFRALVDVCGDTAENFITMASNNFAKSGGWVSGKGSLVDSMGQVFKSPGSVAMLAYGGVAQWRGSFGKSSYGSKHLGYDAANKTLVQMVRGTQVEFAKIREKVSKDSYDNNTQAQLDSLTMLEADFNKWISNNDALFDDANFNNKIKNDFNKDIFDEDGKILKEKVSSAERSIYALVRLQDILGQENNIVSDVVKTTLENKTLEMFKLRNEMVQASMRIKKEQLELAANPFNEGNIDIRKKLKESLNKDTVKKFFKGIGKSKWKSLLSEEEFKEAEAWAISHCDPESIIKCRFANMIKEEDPDIVQTAKDLNSFVDTFTAIDISNSLCSDKADTDAYNKMALYTALETELKNLYNNAGIDYNVKDAEQDIFFVLKEWNHIPEPERSKWSSFDNEIKAIGEICKVNPMTFDSISAHTVKYFDKSGNEKEKTVMRLKQGTYLTKTANNVGQLYETLLAVKTLQAGTPEQKELAVRYLASLLSNDIDEFSTSTEDIAFIIDVLKEHNVLSLREAYTTMDALNADKDEFPSISTLNPYKTVVRKTRELNKLVDKAKKLSAEGDEDKAKQAINNCKNKASEIIEHLKGSSVDLDELLDPKTGLLPPAYKDTIYKIDTIVGNPNFIESLGSTSALGVNFLGGKNTFAFEQEVDTVLKKIFANITNLSDEQVESIKNVDALKKRFKEIKEADKIETRERKGGKKESHFFEEVTMPETLNKVLESEAVVEMNRLDAPDDAKEYLQSLYDISTFLSKNHFNEPLNINKTIDVYEEFDDAIANNKPFIKTFSDSSVFTIDEDQAFMIHQTLKTTLEGALNVSNRKKKEAILEEAEKVSPHLVATLKKHNSALLNSMIKGKTSPDKFATQLIEALKGTKNINRLKECTMKAYDLLGKCDSLNKSSKLVINLAKVDTYYESKLKEKYERDLISGKKDATSAFNILKQSHISKASMVLTDKRYNKFLNTRHQMPFLEFDMNIPEETESARNLLKTFGYTDVYTNEQLKAIDGVSYAPLDDLGFTVKSQTDVDKLFDLQLENGESFSMSAQKDIGVILESLASNSAYLNDNAIVDVNALILKLVDTDIDADSKVVFEKGNYIVKMENTTKVAKTAGAISEFLLRKYDNVTSVRNLSSDSERELSTILSVYELVENTLKYFNLKGDGSEEDKVQFQQSLNNSPVEPDKIKTMKGIGFEFTGENGNIICGFTPNIKKIITNLKNNVSIFDMFPLDEGAFDELKTTPGFGVNLPKKQSVYQREYNNFIYNAMGVSSETEKSVILRIDNLLHLDGILNEQFFRYGYNLDDIELKPGNIQSLKEQLADSKLKRNINAAMLRTAINGVEKLQEQSNGYEFLNVPEFKDVLYTYFTKERNGEVFDLEKALSNAVEHADKSYNKPLKKFKLKFDNLVPDDTIVTRVYGKDRDMSSVTVKNLGEIRYDRETLIELKDAITKEKLLDIEMLINSESVLNYRKVHIDDDEKTSARVTAKAAALRTKEKTEDGFRYSITTSDLAVMSKQDVKEFLDITDADAAQRSKILDAHNNIQKFVNKDFIENFNEETGALENRKAMNRNVDSASVIVQDTYISTGKNDPTGEMISKAHRERAKRNALSQKDRMTRQKEMSVAMNNAKDIDIIDAMLATNYSSAAFTNKASKMFTRLSSSWELGRFGVAVSSFSVLLKELGVDEDVAVKQAIESYMETTGVEVSDGYNGFLVINDKGEIVKRIKTKHGRRDEFDDLCTYLLESPGREFKVVSLEPDEVEQSLTHKVFAISDDERVYNKYRAVPKEFITDGYQYKILFDKKDNETVEDYIKHNPPHLKRQQNIIDTFTNAVEDNMGCSLPKESIGLLFGDSPYDAAQSFNGSANLSTEALYQYIMYENSSIQREDFDQDPNLRMKRINDVFNFGIDKNSMPAHLKASIDLIGRKYNKTISDSNIVKNYNSKIYNKSHNISTKEDISDIFVSYILTSGEGVHYSKILKTLKNKTFNKVSGKKANELVDNFREAQANGYSFDCEWAFDNNGNKYLNEIAFVKFKDGKKESAKTFKLDIRDRIKDKEISDYLAWLNKNNLDIESVLAPNGEAYDTVNDVIEFLNAVPTGSKFISHNGNKADLPILNECDSKLGLAVDRIIKPNHLDTLELIHNVLTQRGNTSGFESIDKLNKIKCQEENKDDTSLGIAHTAEFDAERLVDIIDWYLKPGLVIPRSQQSIYEDSLVTMAHKIGLTDMNEIEEAIKLVDGKLSKVLSDSQEYFDSFDDRTDYVNTIAEYKQLDNKSLRSGMNALDAMFTSMDKKIYNKARDTFNKKMLGSSKEFVEKIKPQYNKVQSIFKSIIFSDLKQGDWTIDETYRVASNIETLYRAINEIYGSEFKTKSDKDEPQNIKTLSPYKLTEAIAKIFNDEDKYNELCSLLSAKGLSFDDKYVNELSMETLLNTFNRNQSIYSSRIQSDYKNDYIKKMDQSSFNKMYNTIHAVNNKEVESMLEVQDIRSKILSVKDEIVSEDSWLHQEDDGSFVEDITQSILDELAYVQDDIFDRSFYDRHSDLTGKELDNIKSFVTQKIKDNSKTYWTEPKYLKELINIIKTNPTIKRSYNKLSPLGYKETIKDISGIKIKATSSVIQMSRKTFESLYKMSYEDARKNLQIEDGELISIAALRHPSDKPASISAYKLCVSKDSPKINKTVRMTNTSVFSNHAGDFDGDNIVLFKTTTPAQNKMLNNIASSNNVGLDIIDSILAETLKSNRSAIERKNNPLNDETIKVLHNYKNSYLRDDLNELSKTCIDKIQGTDIAYEQQDIYSEYLDKCTTLEKKYKLSKEEMNVLIKNFGITKDDIGQQFVYSTKNSDLYTPANKDYLENATANKLFGNANFIAILSRVASTTGKTQEQIMKIKSDNRTTFNLSPIKIDNDTEDILRESFVKNKEVFENVLEEYATQMGLPEAYYKLSDDSQFVDFMCKMQELDFISKIESNTAIKEMIKDGEADEAFKGIQRNTEIRNTALKMFNKYKDEFSGIQVQYPESLWIDTIANALVDDIAKNHYKSSVTNIDNEKYTTLNKWVIVPKDKAELPLDVFIPNPDMAVRVGYQKYIKGNGQQLYKDGQVVREGQTINGIEVSKDCIVKKAYPNGDVELYSSDNKLHTGNKIVDADKKILKSIVAENELNNFTFGNSGGMDKLKTLIGLAEIKGIPSNEIAGIGMKPINLKKSEKSLNDAEVVNIGDYYLVKTNLFINENTQEYDTDGESTIDWYTIGMNSQNSAGVAVFGGAYYELKSDGTYEYNDKMTSDFKRIKDNVGYLTSNFSDGISAYNKITLVTLLDVLPKENISDEDLKYYKDLLFSERIASLDGTLEIKRFVDKYFNGRISDAQKGAKNEKQKEILSQELFGRMLPTTYTSIDKDSPKEEILSKSSAPAISRRTAGLSAYGSDTTLGDSMLEESGVFKPKNPITNFELINMFAKGFLSKDDVISRYPSLPHKASGDRAKPRAYAENDKFGIDDVAQQVINAGSTAKTSDLTSTKELVFDDNFEKQRKLVAPYSTETQKTANEYAVPTRFMGSQKVYNVLKTFSGNADTFEDRIHLLNRSAMKNTSIPLPKRKCIYTSQGEVAVIDKTPTTSKVRTYSEYQDDAKELYSNSDLQSARNQDISFAEPILKEADPTEVKGFLDKVNGLKELGDVEFNSVPEIGKVFENRFKTSTATATPKTQEQLKNIRHGMRPYKYEGQVNKNVVKSVLHEKGFTMAKGNKSSGATLAATRNMVTKNINLVYDAEKKVVYDIEKDLSALRNTFLSQEEYDLFEDYITARSVLDRLDDKEIDEESKTYCYDLLKERDIDVETLKESVERYEKIRPVQVNQSMKIVQKITGIANNISYEMGTGGVHAYNIFSVFSAKKTKNNKSKVAHAIKFAFENNKPSGEILNFFDSVSTVTSHIAKAQSVIDAGRKLRENGDIKNGEVIDAVENILKEALDGSDEIIKYSNARNRNAMFDIISLKTGITPFLDPKMTASEQYRSVLKALHDKEDEFISSGLIKPNESIEDIRNRKSNSAQDYLLIEAIAIKEAIYQVNENILITSPTVKDKIYSYLKGCNNGGTRIVDKIGRKISTGENNVNRRPIDELDVSYIFDAIKDGVGNHEDYKTKLILRALNGDVYKCQELLADKMDEHVYTTTIPNKIQKAIVDTSRFCSKMLMSQPLKIMRRLFQFSSYDVFMSMTANPKTALYLPTCTRHLRAFYQSKGAVCNENLKDYLEHQGFSYNDLKGYDPVLMESAETRTVFDKMYFDHINKAFSMQNLFARYALYTAARNDFADGQERYGVSYHRKNEMQSMNDSEKAIYVVDETLGGPGGFSELSKKLGKKGFVFTTFPLAVARWGTEGASTVKALMEDFIQDGVNKATLKNFMRNCGTPVLTIGATAGVVSLIISALCELFGVDDEDKKKIILEQKFIDPFATIMQNDLVTVEDNSIFQLGAITDSIESLWDENASVGEKIFGVLNDNVLSHINPIIKGTFESLFKTDAFGSNVIPNDNSIVDNAARKMLGYFIGNAGANALINDSEKAKELGYDTLSAYKIGLMNAVGAEMGNTKGYKSNKKNYYKTLSSLNGYLHSLYEDEKFYASDNGYNSDDVYTLGKQIRKAVEKGMGSDYIYMMINEAISKGYNKDEIVGSLKSISVENKLEKIKNKGKLDEYWNSLSESNQNAVLKAIDYEKAMFPFIDKLLDEYDYNGYNSSQYNNDDIYFRYGRPMYHRTPYIQKQYPPRVRDVELTRMPYSKDKTPRIKRTYVPQFTDFTGTKADDLRKLVGKEERVYKKYLKGDLEGTNYKDRRNSRDSISDWRNS